MLSLVWSNHKRRVRYQPTASDSHPSLIPRPTRPRLQRTPLHFPLSLRAFSPPFATSSWRFPDSSALSRATAMATECAAAAADLATGRPRKRARFGWDVAPAAEVNAPHRLSALRCAVIQDTVRRRFRIKLSPSTLAMCYYDSRIHGSCRSRSFMCCVRAQIYRNFIVVLQN